MDRIEAMGVFVATAELRSFAAAARRARLSPSAVTRLVAALEERLGTRLLHRTTRSVTLTDAGTRYLERARRILADVAEAEGAAQAERSVPSGRFVVTASQVFGRLHVAPLLSRYLALHPAVSAELVVQDRVVNLVEEGIDAAVRIGALDDTSLVVRSIGATRRVVVAAPSYFAGRKPPRRPEDIAGHELIQCTAITPAQEWRFHREGKEQRIAIRPRFVTNSADIAIGHAERGFGLTMALGYQIKAAIGAGRLKVLMPGFEAQPLPIQIVYPTSRLLSAKVRAFIDLALARGDWRFVDL